MSENGYSLNGWTKWTLADAKPRMDLFLEKLRDSGNVRLSCKAADVPRSTIYYWRNKYVTFANAWDDALEDALDLLEGEAWRRARDNSDRLLMYLLTAHRPDKYGDRVKVESDNTLTIEVKGGYRNHSD